MYCSYTFIILDCRRWMDLGQGLMCNTSKVAVHIGGYFIRA
nr:MAG TPA: hypothetical protein [Caudoviricetes sp.]